MGKASKVQGQIVRRYEEIGDYTYIGASTIGRSEDSEEWTITRVDSASGVIEYATGSWTDRATLTYY